MKQFAVMIACLVLGCFSSQAAFAGGGKIALKTAHTGTLISSNRDHSEELLVNALVQMAWAYTYQEKFESLTQSIASEFTGGDQEPGKGLPIAIEVESSIKNTKVNFVYRF